MQTAVRAKNSTCKGNTLLSLLFFAFNGAGPRQEEEVIACNVFDLRNFGEVHAQFVFAKILFIQGEWFQSPEEWTPTHPL